MAKTAMTKHLLDPTGEHEIVARKKAPRPLSLDGVTVGLLDIGKARGNIFLDRVAERLAEHQITVKRYAKPTPSRLVSAQTKAQMSTEVQVTIIGLADLRLMYNVQFARRLKF